MAGIVLDIPFADLSPMVCLKVSRIRGLPGFLVPGVMRMGRIPFGIDLASVCPVEAVQEIRCTVLFVRGPKDELAESSNSVRLCESERELWLA